MTNITEIVKGLEYTPDADIEVHKEGAIKLLCAVFQSHEAGLPEWAKNAADEYVRTSAPESERLIVLNFDNGTSSRKPSIACLDFSGMTSKVIEDQFRIWADPNAARATGKAHMQGGHGNGAKCYMTQMFDNYAFLHTAKGGLGCRYGVTGGTVNFGYVPDPATGKDFAVGDLNSQLDNALAEVGCSSKSLPPEAIAALGQRNGFTLFVGRGPKGYGNKIPVASLVESIRDHTQMIETLELCKVFVLQNGKPIKDCWPIVLAELSPDPAFAQPRVIAIPDELTDPETGQAVSTIEGGKKAAGELVLKTSDVSMRWKRKGRHTITFRAESGYIGYCPVPELDVQSTFKDRIYGDCTLMSLESAKQNDRARLARTPLSRAVEAFTAAEVQKLALEFEARDKRSYSQNEKEGLSKINDALDKWKNKWLGDFLKGMWGPGGDGEPPVEPPLPSGTPVSIEVYLGHQYAGIGVSLRPGIHFFDADGRRVRAVPYEWVSDDTNVAMVDATLNVINTFSAGQTKISARSLDGKLTSNEVELTVVRVRSITLAPAEVEVAVGSRHAIEAQCKLSSGEVLTDVSLIWTEGNTAVARVSSSGMVFGIDIGDTDVSAGDDKCEADAPVEIRVTEGEGKGAGDKHGGRGFPRILVSGVNRDPDTNDIVTLSTDDPPVYQRPEDADRNIWWINSSSPMARLYLDKTAGYGFDSREWRVYHIERYIEVMVQIALVYDPNRGTLTANDWIFQWGEGVSAVQAAAAASLAGFIQTGDTTGVPVA